MNILMRVCSEYIYSLLSVKQSEEHWEEKGFENPASKGKKLEIALNILLSSIILLHP